MTTLPAVSVDLDSLFLTVCHNEVVASYRELEDSLAPVARALLAGWRPDPQALEGTARQRAAYLIDLLSGWMPAAQARLAGRSRIAGGPKRGIRADAVLSWRSRQWPLPG